MRTAYNDVDLVSENGNIIGINLGFDFCAEHEWGVKGIAQDLGVGELEDAAGLLKGLATELPENLCFKTYKPRDPEKQPLACLALVRKWHDIDENFAGVYKSMKKSLENSWKEIDIFSKWCDREFAVIVRGEENVKALSDVYAAFQNKGIVVGLTPASFKGTGLTFLIYDRISEESRNEAIEADRAEQRLQKAIDETGIIKKLREAGCSYYACNGKWADGIEGGKLTFWLNPMEQSKNNYGWMSLKDLEDWCEGKGRIPMKGK